MATVLTVTANPLLDHLAEADAAFGAARRIDAFRIVAGGKGVNVGRVLARHGHRVIATGFAGGSSGASFVQLVAADGMEPDFIATAARLRLGFLCSQPERRPLQVMEHGFAVDAGEVGQLVERVRVRAAGCDLVVIGGSIPDPRAHDLFRLLVEACHHLGVPCWLDAYGPAMVAALTGPHPPDLVKPNREEYGEDHRSWTRAKELHLTDGPACVRVRHPQARYRVTPPAVQERNPVGSGDCYLAALAHARLAGWPLERQLAYAAAAGAANAAAGTVACIGPEAIEALRTQVRVELAAD